MAASLRGEIFDIYGGVFARPNVFNPDAPPRKKRALRTSDPEVHYFKTEDNVRLRLTRYQGGKKGPVILAHGLGVSSLAFSTDLIETNMTEYLFAHGYDVWLLDYRSSIELPYAATPYTADDVAVYDWPAAVKTVLSLTGASIGSGRGALLRRDYVQHGDVPGLARRALGGLLASGIASVGDPAQSHTSRASISTSSSAIWASSR